MADWRQNYGATSAPLAVGDLVVSGMSGGDEGVRGFVAAFDQATGKEVWRFWTVARARRARIGDLARQRHRAPVCVHVADRHVRPELDIVYWPTGNPCPDLRRQRAARRQPVHGLDRGARREDGQAEMALPVHAARRVGLGRAAAAGRSSTPTWRGQPRKLLLQANRNGFFYVLDRTNGELLLGKPFVKKLTWARGIDAEGRPVLNADQEPTASGTTASVRRFDGATNWFSTSFSPATGLYYVQTLERCSVYSPRPGRVDSGRGVLRAARRGTAPGERRTESASRDRHPDRRRSRGNCPEPAPATRGAARSPRRGASSSSAEDSGAFMAADAANGKAALAVSDQHALEGVADDVRLRRAAVRGDCGRAYDRRVRAGALAQRDQLPTPNFPREFTRRSQRLEP